MPGASEQTRSVKVLNANWTPQPDTADGEFQILIITDDDARYAYRTSPAALTALVTLARADTVLVWDPSDTTLIVANIVGEVPWTNQPRAAG